MCAHFSMSSSLCFLNTYNIKFRFIYKQRIFWWKEKVNNEKTLRQRNTEYLWGSDKFRVETYIIIDKLVAELTKRRIAYDHVTQLFGFRTQLLTIECRIGKSSESSHRSLLKWLNNNILIELKHFVPRVKFQERVFFSRCV